MKGYIYFLLVILNINFSLRGNIINQSEILIGEFESSQL